MKIYLIEDSYYSEVAFAFFDKEQAYKTCDMLNEDNTQEEQKSNPWCVVNTRFFVKEMDVIK